MGGDRTPNESLNQALKLEAAKAVVEPSARLREVTSAPAERRLHHLNVTGNDLYADGAATPVESEGTTVGRVRVRRWTRARETSKNRRHPLVSHTSMLAKGTDDNLIDEGKIQEKPCRVTTTTRDIIVGQPERKPSRPVRSSSLTRRLAGLRRVKVVLVYCSLNHGPPDWDA
jgi:hypothetical protein